MGYFVYILLSKIRKSWSYVGSCNDITRRIKDHDYGKVKSTKGMRPLVLIYVEIYKTELEALKREKYLKSGSGREEKSFIINNI